MENFLTLVLFLLGLLLILKGGDLLVESSIWFGLKTKIPSIVIGATIVAVATTFPETTVSVIASFGGNTDLAVNTAIGAMISNFTLVLGISFLIYPCAIKTDGFSSKSKFFIATLLLLLLLSVDGKLSIIDSIILLVTFALFIFFNIFEAKKFKQNLEFSNEEKTPSWLYIIIQFVLSAFAIGFGAKVMVNNVLKISQMLNINEQFLGMTVIAIGTNLPELVTSISSIKMRNPEIGIGNIFGASIINCTMLLSLVSVCSPQKILSISLGSLIFSIITLLFITATIAIPIKNKNKSSRLQGGILIATYILYSVIMLFLLK